MQFKKLLARFACPQCDRIFRCECGYVVAAIIAIAVAAAAAGYSAYAASEAQAQQNDMAKRAAKISAEAEEAAGIARANQIAYDAKKKQRSFLSRAAAAGVDTSSGSLLETEEEFAAEASYAQQLAKYPYQIAGFSDEYKSKLFGFQEKQARSGMAKNIGIAAGSTLATGAAKMYGSGYTGPSNTGGGTWT